MSKSKLEWQEAKAAVIAALDILGEYERLGLKVSNREPNPKGWVAAHAIGHTQNTPSAGINIGDGPLRGRYKDFSHGGVTSNFFDFVAKQRGWDYKTVLVHYAKQTGVKLPSEEEESATSKLELGPLTFGVMQNYARGKTGVSIEAIKKLGGQAARWPKGLSPEKTNYLIAFPMYGSSGLMELDATGYHVVAANPRGKVRKFRGQGHEDQLIKSLTIGDYGLMNQHGLSRLPKVSRVVLLEGISDLLAAATICPDDADEVVLSAGGSSYSPKPEWLSHFLGKEVWVCFDVGDKDDSGQIGAQKWIGALLSAGITVRNIKLPQPSGGGKMDFREWVTSGNRTWSNFCELAATFEPVQPGDTDSGLSEHEALLKSLGLVVVGEHENSQKIEVYCEKTKKAATINDVDKLSFAKLTQLCGYQVVDQYVHDGKEAPAGKVLIKDVRIALSSAASDRVFSSDAKFGGGVWEIDNKIVLVQAREMSIVETTTRLSKWEIPYYNGKIVDLARTTPSWYDHGEVARLMLEAQDPGWCQSVFAEAERLFSQWYWRYSPSAKLITGLIPCSWFQTLWPWRPQVAITGGTSTGKSALIEDVLTKGIFQGIAMFIEKPTEASIIQHLRHHAKILFIDEFEKDHHRAAVLKMLRGSARGTKIVRGTADQRGAEYHLHHLPWVAAIELGLKWGADANRFLIFELNEIPHEETGKHEVPSHQQLHYLGMKMLVVGIRHYQTARRLSVMLSKEAFHQVSGRLRDSFAPPAAFLSAVAGHTDEQAVEHLGAILSAWDFGGQQVQDEASLLKEILTGEVILEAGQRMSVTQLLRAVPSPDYTQALERSGLSRVVLRSRKAFPGDPGQTCLFIEPDTVKRQLLRFGDFGAQQIEQYLLRIPGADRYRARLGGDQRFSGIVIPMSRIEQIFSSAAGTDDEGEDPDDSIDDIVNRFT